MPGFRVRATSFWAAWLLCLLPRTAVVFASWPNIRVDTSSVQFADGVIKTTLTQPFWPPLYGLIASCLWFLSAHHVGVYVAEHVAVQALIGPTVLWLCSSLNLTKRAGWLSAIAVAMLPYYVSTSVRQIDVGVTVVVVAIAIASYAWWLREGRRPRTISGIGFAIAAFVLFLLRSNAISLIVALYTLAWWRRPRVSVGPFGASIGVFLALMSGVTVVHGLAFDHFTPFPANLGYNLFIGNNPGAAAYLARRDVDYSTMVSGPSNLLPDRPGDQYADDMVLSRHAVQYLVTHRADTIHGMALKFERYWDVDLGDSPPHTGAQKILYAVPYLLYLPLAFVGFATLLRTGQHWTATLLVVVVAAYFVPHLFAFGTIRMRMAMEFVLLVLAAVAVDRWWLTQARDQRVGADSTGA